MRALALMVADDPRSITCQNLRLLRELTGLEQPHMYSSSRVKASLPVQRVPEKEQWRLALMACLLQLRIEKHTRAEDTSNISVMIGSLCAT